MLGSAYRLVPMETKTKSCHACGRPILKGGNPRDGLSTCSDCRAAGVDPRDVEKNRMFDEWVKAEVIDDRDSILLTRDLWGMYMSWVVGRDAENFFGKDRFCAKLEAAGHGYEVRAKRSRKYVGVRTVTPTS